MPPTDEARPRQSEPTIPRWSYMEGVCYVSREVAELALRELTQLRRFNAQVIEVTYGQ